MKRDILDVLVYLYDSYLTHDCMVWEGPEERVVQDLEHAGFGQEAVYHAMEWLQDMDGVADPESHALLESTGIRIYTAEEAEYLNIACRGFLQGLEDAGVLDPVTREYIIEKTMSLNTGEIDLEDFKRVVGLILLSAPQPHPEQDEQDTGMMELEAEWIDSAEYMVH